MSEPSLVFLCLLLLTGNSCHFKDAPRGQTLKEAYKELFYIGAALDLRQIYEQDSMEISLVKNQFNSITATNIMKWEKIHPGPGVYDFGPADRFVDFGEKNDMFIVGHVLVWHNQTPDWVFRDESGDLTVRDTLLQRMRDHIQAVVGRYRGRVHCWDVVNEAVGDDGKIRKSHWSNIIGDDFVMKAFAYAREADPGAILVYNDYSLPNPVKREAVVRMVRDLQSKGVNVDAIGMQGHYHLDYPSPVDLESSILAFSDLGCKIMITELDINVLPSPTLSQGADVAMNEAYRASLNPYTEGLPDTVQLALAEKYAELFSLFARHADKIDRVTFWGVHDGTSWKNNWPVLGRTNYPLLFDRQYQPKPAYDSVIEIANKYP